jgi:hypothetical protein
MLLRLFLLAIVVVTLGFGAAAYLAVDGEPLVSGNRRLGQAQVERAKQLVARNDPRKLRHGEVHTVVLSEQDVTLLCHYLLSRFGSGGAAAQITPETLQLAASVKLPHLASNDGYVNIAITMREAGTLPHVEYLRIGRLPIPSDVANAALRRGLDLLYSNAGVRATTDAIQKVRISDGRLSVTYRWDSHLPDTLKAQLFPEAERKRMQAYQERLAEITMAPADVGSISLATLAGALLALAQERSPDGDPVRENRTAILVLLAYVNGSHPGAFAPEARAWPRARRLAVRLQGRHDFAQHFITSAAIAAIGDTAIAHAVGLYKEVDDSRGGSGFSFRDLAADRAGTRFGELATASAKSAHGLQRKASQNPSDDAIMPPVADLPENMQEAEFKARFGGVWSSAYNRMTREIDRRIASAALYR